MLLAQCYDQFFDLKKTKLITKQVSVSKEEQVRMLFQNTQGFSKASRASLKDFSGDIDRSIEAN